MLTYAQLVIPTALFGILVYVCALCTITGNQQLRRFDPELMVQIEDLLDFVYRPKEGATEEINSIARVVHAPFKKLKDIRSEEKAMLSLTASTVIPAIWSECAGGRSLLIYSDTMKLDKTCKATLKARTPHYYAWPRGPVKKR